MAIAQHQHLGQGGEGCQNFVPAGSPACADLFCLRCVRGIVGEGVQRGTVEFDEDGAFVAPVLDREREGKFLCLRSRAQQVEQDFERVFVERFRICALVQQSGEALVAEVFDFQKALFQVGVEDARCPQVQGL